MWADSVSSVRRNFRRAGRLKKSWRTSTVVPGAVPAALTSSILPPLMMICVPSGKAADAGDAGQRLAAEPHGRDGGEVFGALDFAGGMAFEAKQGVVAAHTEAVVHDPDEAAAAGLDVDGDAGRLGVEGVLDQFLDDAGGTFHHFARRDLISDVIGQQTNAVHVLLFTG